MESWGIKKLEVKFFNKKAALKIQPLPENKSIVS